MRYLIVHKEDGIFLGEFLGLGFCSKLDPAGQDAAITFGTPEECTEFIMSWASYHRGEVKLTDYSFVPVEPSQGEYASIDDCVRAGLDSWIPD